MSQIRNVALVRGGVVDGPGLKGVCDISRGERDNVGVAQDPTVSLEDDVALTRRVLDGMVGPTVLVGHSYDRAVIGGAGTHEDVAALVSITAFAPVPTELDVLVGFGRLRRPRDRLRFPGPSQRSMQPRRRSPCGGVLVHCHCSDHDGSVGP